MKKKSILFLSSLSLDDRNFKRFGINKLENLGWEVNYFECSKLFRSRNYFKSKGGANASIDYSKVIYPKNYLELIFLVKNKSPTIIVDLLGQSFVEIYFMKYLSRKNKIMKLSLGAFPTYKHSFLNKVQKKFNETNLLSFIFVDLLKFINFNLFGFKKINYTFELVSGKNSITTNIKTKKLFTHSFDYENFLELKSKNKNIYKSVSKNSKLLVFLDDGCGRKSDVDAYFRNAKINENFNNYYIYTNKILEYYNEKHNYDIVICTHPKASIAMSVDKFKFKVVKNSTLDHLVNCDYVFSYSSTAIQYAVLLNKPILFYNYFGNFKASHKKYYYNETKAFAAELGSQHIILDYYYNKPPELKDKIDEKKYNKYIENYIKSKNSFDDKSIWEVVSKEIN